MKLRSLFGAALPILAHCAWAQSTFNKAFEYGDMGCLEQVTGPAGFVICSTVRFGSGDIDGFQFTRFDSTGNVLNTSAFSTGSLVNVMQWAALSRRRSNGTFAFLFGSSPYNGGYRPSFRVFNTTESGSIIWNRQISYTDPDSSFDFIGAMDQAFEETPDGGTLITGLRRSPTSGAPVVVKLDPAGNILWNKTYDLHLPFAWHIVSDVDEVGDVLLGFHADSIASVVSENCILTKMTSDGITLWSKRFDDFQGRLTGCTSVNGRYVVSAMDSSSIYIIEIDTAGLPSWGRRYSMAFPLPTWGARIVPTYDHGFVLTTQMPDSTGGSDVFFFKVDSLGTTQWERAYGNLNYEWLVDVAENGDNTLTMLTGTQLIENWSVHYYLSRLDPTGLNDCIMPFGGVITETPTTFSLVDVTLDEFESQMNSQPLYLNDSLSNDPLMMDTCLLDVGAGELRAADELRIHPNPTVGPAQVHIPAHLLGARFTLLDLMGKEVLSTTLTGITTTIELGVLPAGVYPYRVSGHGGTMLFGRAVKE